MHSGQKLSSFFSQRRNTQAFCKSADEATARLEQAAKDEKLYRGELQTGMGEAWRSLLREPVRTARAAAQGDAQKEIDSFLMSLRAKAIDLGHCDTCDQDVVGPAIDRLRSTLPSKMAAPVPSSGISTAMSRLADLSKFQEADNAGEIRLLWKRILDSSLEQVTLRDRLIDLNAALADSDPDTLRRSKASYADVIEKISVVKRAIDEETKKADEKDQNIQRLKKKLESSGTSDLRAGQLRAKMLRDASEVFGAAIERYKSDLRSRV